MSWYKRVMPSVSDLASVVDDISKQAMAIRGVTAIYAWGSYAENITNPSYLVKDIDIIAATDFDSGDLLAIDNTRESALRIRPSELEDEGFNPVAVAFTKAFLALEKFNVDHWATTADGKLLHWGAIPETAEEWQELHLKAEKRAQEETGLKRAQLYAASDIKRKEWRKAHDQYLQKTLGSKTVGWCPSMLTAEEIADKTIKLRG